ncbi:MAG: phosphoribosylglycinamide formyltransferase [Thermoanaerobaculia bacterium]|nr:phosphoribosylglycinamide formyltransferase [Thermoanaerobaculia bacterium]
MSGKRLAVLLSGRGSNFLAIHDAIERDDLPAEIVLVVSNRAEAPGIARAREIGYDAVVLPHREFETRDAHEKAVAAEIERRDVDLVLLAGYMRLLGEGFVARFRNRILNIHPSLLPAFPGLDAQKQAVEYGVRVSGCTVHFVDEGLDSGPIIVQRAVPVNDGDSAEDLAARILEEEHVAYVEAVRRLVTEPWTIEGRRVVFEG